MSSTKEGAEMRLAVVGTGISGLLAARLLHARHELTVFEAAPRLGGHTHTRDVVKNDRSWAVDSGFIVFNERTYPNFSRLMDLLGVETQLSEMSFSVRDETSGLEWCGTDLNRLFAQRRNLFKPSFWRMIRDVMRFNRESPRFLENPDPQLTLGQFLDRARYSRPFVDHYIVPMGAAIWSAAPQRMREFPAHTFMRFFHNHGMLQVNDRPSWRVVRGGSWTYIDTLVQPFRDTIQLNSPVSSVRRTSEGVELTVGDTVHAFDEVVLAVHSDQALAMLADPSDAETEILGALPYQKNEAVLHTDERLLPRRRRAWAAWNYVVPRDSRNTVSVTYDMNTLQGLDAPFRFCLTLNPCQDIDESRVLERMTYHHPVFTTEGVAAQSRRDEIDGQRHTHYCGAYWRYGFHEDGVLSALHVARRFGIDSIEEAAQVGPAPAREFAVA